MRKAYFIAVIFALVLCACTPQQPVVPPTEAPSPAASSTPRAPVATVTPTPEQDLTATADWANFQITLAAVKTEVAIAALPKTSTPSPLPSPSPTPTATQLGFDDPRLVALEKAGFVRVPIGGRVVYELIQGKYVYIQYKHTNLNNCAIVFLASENGRNRVMAVFEADKLGQHIQEGLRQTLDVMFGPDGWSDINQNGKPDMVVGFYWAGQYNGSELHIFEVTDDNTVTDLTGKLAGIVSPLDFDPSRTQTTRLVVADVQWAQHDCIYPPMWIAWTYDWRDRQYVDITPEVGYGDLLSKTKAVITGALGGRLYRSMIEKMTQLLLLYDHSGQREQGWKAYRELANPEHWPGSEQVMLDWLASDVAHFEQEYRAGLAFTPNDFCKWQQ